MGEIVVFKPKSTRDAQQNLQSFIKLCRNKLTVFGSDLEWESSVWPRIAVFAKLGVKTRRPKPAELMDSAFVDFAKAYLRYQQGHQPTKTRNETKALRAIEAALLQVAGNGDIRNISISVLDEAALLAASYYSKGAAYQCGREIERLAAFVSAKKLCNTNVRSWISPVKRNSDTVRTGAEAKAQRAKKLPNEDALNALAEIFANTPDDERDIFTTSTFAMLMSAPSRISEVLALPADCEHSEFDSTLKEGEEKVERYGWRFFSGKGYEGDIKWIPTPMVGVAKEAIRRIKHLSRSARQLARWIEKNPDKFYRHPGCPNVSEDTPLTMKEACRALGLEHSSRKACQTSLANRRLAAADGVHTLGSLWLHVLTRLPEGFPWLDKEKGIRYSEALFALNKNQFHGNRGRLPVELHKPTNNFFNNDLSPRKSVGAAHRSIFDRNGYRSESGARLKLTSHQARHLLNTIAQRGGLSSLEIAKWSGRADHRQNRTYNHMSDYEFVELTEDFDPSKSLFGPSSAIEKHVPVSTLEFNTLESAAAHVTEFGFCVHDYTISPCEKYRDCVNCTEHVCLKGGAESLERIKARLQRTERLCEFADDGIRNGDMGADRWYQYQMKTVTRLRELVSILEDPNIEDGAMVKLKGNDFSQLRRVIAKKSAEAVIEKDKSIGELVVHDDVTGDGHG